MICRIRGEILRSSSARLHGSCRTQTIVLPVVIAERGQESNAPVPHRAQDNAVRGRSHLRIVEGIFTTLGRMPNRP
jgi:hypothetical protein